MSNDDYKRINDDIVYLEEYIKGIDIPNYEDSKFRDKTYWENYDKPTPIKSTIKSTNIDIKSELDKLTDLIPNDLIESWINRLEVIIGTGQYKNYKSWDLDDRDFPMMYELEYTVNLLDKANIDIGNKMKTQYQAPPPPTNTNTVTYPANDTTFFPINTTDAADDVIEEKIVPQNQVPTTNIVAFTPPKKFKHDLLDKVTYLLNVQRDFKDRINELSIRVGSLESKSTSQPPMPSVPATKYVKPDEIVSQPPQQEEPQPLRQMQPNRQPQLRQIQPPRQQQQVDFFLDKLLAMFARGGSYRKGVKMSRRYKKKGGTRNKRKQKAHTRRIR
jgi:hypothetical protein